MRNSISNVWLIEGKPEPWVIKFVWKPFVVLFVWANTNTLRLSPNAITLLGGAFGLLSALSFASQSFLLGGVFFVVWRIMDYADGMTARLNKRTSALGGVLDNYVGGIALLLTSIGFGYGMFLKENMPLWLLFPSIVLFLALFQSYTSLSMSTTLKTKAHDRIVSEHSHKTRKNIFQQVVAWLNKNNLAPPLGQEDIFHGVFFGVPVLMIIHPLAAFGVIPLLMILCTTIFVKHYLYFSLLISHERSDKKRRDT